MVVGRHQGTVFAKLRVGKRRSFMKILLTGASGFIGRRLLCVLQDDGHELVVAARRAPDDRSLGWAAIDFARPMGAGDWAPHLAGVDVVVNLVGLFRERDAQTFQALHIDAPRALFDACVRAGVGRVVHLSALGVEAASNAYQRSKNTADEHLLGLPLRAAVVRPSLVFGRGGASAALFLTLASLPVLPLPDGGHQRLQPMHVDDAVQALRLLIERHWDCGIVELVGPRPLALRDYLQALRRGLGLPSAATLALPSGIVALGVRLAEKLPGSLIDRASWQMLQQGSVADPAATTRLLGHAPRDVDAFIEGDLASGLRQQALWRWMNPLLRWSVALVWIVTGVVSFGLYPVPDSLALLARAGVPEGLRTSMLYGAASLDLLLGVLTVWPMRAALRRPLWLTQIALIAGYSLIITLKLPEFWLHPYGPVLKNLPLLALLWLMWLMESRAKDSSWNT